MTTLRFNELRGEQVLYAAQRQDRTFLPTAGQCPLCPMRAGDPPTEIPLPSYQLAVFDNRFPSLEAPAGAAEIVVYTDDHRGSFGGLPPERAEALMWVWRHRYEQLGARPDVDYVLIFENRGVEVGTTLQHPHGQIYGYPFIPPVAQLERAADERLGGCAVCTLLERELADETRVIHRSPDVVAYVPYAARWPYEVHVVMRAHRANLSQASAEELSALAAALQSVTQAYDRLFAAPFPYVMVVHQAPSDGRGDGHLHVEFYPPRRTAHKLKFLAGSEHGAGTFIVDALPEATARSLREAIAGDR